MGQPDTDFCYEYFHSRNVQLVAKEWFNIFSCKGELVAVASVKKLIIDCLMKCGSNNVSMDIRLPETESANECKLFLQNLTRDKLFDPKKQQEEGQCIAAFIKEITKCSALMAKDMISWMKKFEEFLCAMVANERTTIIVAESMVNWYGSLVLIPQIERTMEQEFKHEMNILCEHAASTICQQTKRYVAIKMMASQFFRLIKWKPKIMEWDQDGVGKLYEHFLKYDDDEVIIYALESTVYFIDQYNPNNENRRKIIEICSCKEIIDRLSDLIIICKSKKILKNAFAIAAQIQGLKPTQKLFKSEALGLIFTHNDFDIRQSAATLFHKSFFNPNKPTGFIQQSVKFYKKYFAKFSAELMIKACLNFNEFTNWGNMFKVISENLADHDFTLEVAAVIITTVQIIKEDETFPTTVNDLIREVILAMNPLQSVHKELVAKMLEILINIDISSCSFDKALRQKLATKLNEITIGYFEMYEPQFNAVSLAHQLSKWRDFDLSPLVDTVLENFKTSRTFMWTRQTPHEAENSVVTSFMNISVIAELRLVGDKDCTQQLAFEIWIDLFEKKLYDDVTINRTLLGYNLITLTETWIALLKIHKSSPPKKHLANFVDYLIGLLTNMDGSVDLLGYATFTSLCRLRYFFGNVSESYVQKLIDFLTNQFNLLELNPNLIREDRHIWAHIEIMCLALQHCIGCKSQINAVALITKMYENFQYNDLVAGLLNALAKAQKLEIFSEPVAKIFYLESNKKPKQEFAKKINEMISLLHQQRQQVNMKKQIVCSLSLEDNINSVNPNVSPSMLVNIRGVIKDMIRHWDEKIIVELMSQFNG